MKSPQFLNTRRNMAEFGRAVRANKLVRMAFQSLAVVRASSTLANRLTAPLLNVVKSDQLGEYGERRVEDGNIDLLKGFEFNESASLSSRFKAPFTTGIDRKTGKVWIDILSYKPLDCIDAPAWATHFKISFAAAALDFEKNSYEQQVTSTMELPLDGRIVHMKLCQTLNLTNRSTVLLAVALEFFQQSGGVYRAVNVSEQAMAIVDTSGC